MKNRFPLQLALIAAMLASPAMAEVKPTNATSFASSHLAQVDATPDDLWKRLIAPKDWWNPSHSWSGSTSGFYIDAQAGGCFCELFQNKDAKGQLKTEGSVEHMRVIHAQPGKVLRMQGALGPLQSEAVLGTLTIAIEAMPGGKVSKVSFNYVVGGHTRFPPDKMAAAVDGVIAEQFTRFLAPFKKGAAMNATGAEALPNPLPDSSVEKPVADAAPMGSPKPGDTSFDLRDIDEKAAGESVAETPEGEESPAQSPKA